jgi:hypothetical protein
VRQAQAVRFGCAQALHQDLRAANGRAVGDGVCLHAPHQQLAGVQVLGTRADQYHGYRRDRRGGDSAHFRGRVRAPARREGCAGGGELHAHPRQRRGPEGPAVGGRQARECTRCDRDACREGPGRTDCRLYRTLLLPRRTVSVSRWTRFLWLLFLGVGRLLRGASGVHLPDGDCRDQSIRCAERDAHLVGPASASSSLSSSRRFQRTILSRLI